MEMMQKAQDLAKSTTQEGLVLKERMLEACRNQR